MRLRIPNPAPLAPAAAVYALFALLTTGCLPDFFEQQAECREGTQRLADDGCNICVCDGGAWACTAMYCEPECACPEIWAPVCGADGQTYGNGCEASCAGVDVVSDDACGGVCPDPADPAVTYISDDPAECAAIAFRCGGDARAFSDDCGCGCIADDPVECGEGEVLHDNQCKTLCDPAAEGAACPEGAACGGCVPDPDCPECDVCLMVCEPVPGPPPACDGCPEIWAPVCGLDGLTYGNACEADCAGARVAYEGECREACEDGPQGDGPGDTPCEPEPEPEPCECAFDWAPVCGLDGQSYFNACDAACAGTMVGYEGECYQWCLDPEGQPPADDEGAEEGGASNPGDAGEAPADGEPEDGAPVADAPGDVLCDPPQPRCVCPEVYAPMCGTDGRTYANECAAACAHADIAYEGECVPDCGADGDAPGDARCG